MNTTQTAFRTSLFTILTGALVLLQIQSVFAAPPLVAAIIPGNLPRYQQAHAALTAVLDKAGFDKDKVKIIIQKPNADNMSLANSIRRLSAAGAKILITYGSQATVIAKKEASDQTVIFTDVYDPVGLDIIKTLSAPGVKRTGATSKTPIKLLVDTMTEIRPLKSVGILYNKEDDASVFQMEEVKAELKKRQISFSTASAESTSSMPSALEEMLSSIEAVYFTEALSIQELGKDLISIATAKGVPVFSQCAGLAEAGSLLNLEADTTEQGNLIGIQAIRVLTGTDPFVLSVRPASKIGLVINKNSAEALNITLTDAVKGKATLVE